MAFWDRFKKKKEESVDDREKNVEFEDVEQEEEQSQSSVENTSEEIVVEKSESSDEKIDETEIDQEESPVEEGLSDKDTEVKIEEEIIDQSEIETDNEVVDEAETEKEFAEDSEEQPKEEKLSFLERLKLGLTKTRSNIAERIDDILASTRTVDEDMMEDLEDTLISADLGMESTMEIIDQLRDVIKRKNIKDAELVKKELIEIMKQELTKNNLDSQIHIENTPLIILVVGVNGVGKTTTIGKMAYQYKEKGKKVLLVAADTFRAAAIEQLTEWANRAEVDIISHKEGADPASVIFDGIAAAKNKESDIIICDTAGRLHNKKNLMNELNKIHRVIEKEYPTAQKEVLLVLDGTTGQNAIFQAKEFKEAADLTGIVITKMDGTAKGGVIFPLQAQMEIPVKLIGIGEQIDNLVEFDSEAFVEAIVN